MACNVPGLSKGQVDRAGETPAALACGSRGVGGALSKRGRGDVRHAYRVPQQVPGAVDEGGDGLAIVRQERDGDASARRKAAGGATHEARALDRTEAASHP